MDIAVDKYPVVTTVMEMFPRKLGRNVYEVICFYMGPRDSFTNYPYGFFLFSSLSFFNTPLNCNK